MYSSRNVYVVSVILIGCGIIFMILPAFKIAPEKEEALFFAGVMSFLSGFLLRYMKK
jgi:hypothetical protein